MVIEPFHFMSLLFLENTRITLRSFRLHQLHLFILIAKQCLSIAVVAMMCLFRPSVELRLESVALRQSECAERSAEGRPRITALDRIFWVWLENV
jgi:hypothetical protein